jgi:hypothetical protein
MKDDVAKVAAGLSSIERLVAEQLCGNAWEGSEISPGLMLMNNVGLMHLDVLKDNNGTVRRVKARPTSLGLAVRAYLQGQQP